MFWFFTKRECAKNICTEIKFKNADCIFFETLTYINDCLFIIIQNLHSFVIRDNQSERRFAFDLDCVKHTLTHSLTHSKIVFLLHELARAFYSALLRDIYVVYFLLRFRQCLLLLTPSFFHHIFSFSQSLKKLGHLEKHFI